MTRQQTRTRTPQRKAGRKTPASRRKSPASRRTGVASRLKSPARRKSSTRKTKPKQKSHKKKQSLRHGFHRMLSGGMNGEQAENRLAAIKETLDGLLSERRARGAQEAITNANTAFETAKDLVAKFKKAYDEQGNAEAKGDGEPAEAAAEAALQTAAAEAAAEAALQTAQAALQTAEAAAAATATSPSTSTAAEAAVAALAGAEVIETEIENGEGRSADKSAAIYRNGYSGSELAMGMGAAGLTTGMLGYNYGKKSKHKKGNK